MKCEKCGHEWLPRVKQPKQCPKCKQYITYVFVKTGEVDLGMTYKAISEAFKVKETGTDNED